MTDGKIIEQNTLVASAKAGSDVAFALLAEQYAGLLKKYVMALNVPVAEREDLMQEAFLGLLRAVRTFDGVSSNFSTYASTCVKNSVLSALRRYAYRHNEVSLEGIQLNAEETVLSPEMALIDVETTNGLHDKFVSVLSAYEKTVFEMYLAEIPYVTMAKKLGKNEKSIDNAIQRIKAKLKKLV